MVFQDLELGLVDALGEQVQGVLGDGGVVCEDVHGLVGCVLRLEANHLHDLEPPALVEEVLEEPCGVADLYMQDSIGEPDGLVGADGLFFDEVDDLALRPALGKRFPVWVRDHQTHVVGNGHAVGDTGLDERERYLFAESLELEGRWGLGDADVELALKDADHVPEQNLDDLLVLLGHLRAADLCAVFEHLDAVVTAGEVDFVARMLEHGDKRTNRSWTERLNVDGGPGLLFPSFLVERMDSELNLDAGLKICERENEHACLRIENLLFVGWFVNNSLTFV